MTFRGFILSIVFGAFGLTGIFVSFNFLQNWVDTKNRNTLTRDILYGAFVLSLASFYVGLWGLFPFWIAFWLIILSTAFLAMMFWGGADHTIRALWDPSSVDREIRTLQADAEQKERTALAGVEEKLATFVPTPGPFSLQYFDAVPLAKLGSVLKPAQDTHLAGYADFDASKLKTVRDASATWKPELKQLFRKEVPFGFTKEHRLRHQFIVAPTGSGKTTLLSTQINEDLNKVARNEASVFVMDSQNQLVLDIARLKRFAPGGDLHGKLVYIEYEPDYPLCLNIFDFNKELMASLSSSQRMTLQRGTEEMIFFFMETLVKADTSGFMDAILKTVLRAVMLIPGATVLTFKEFLQKGGFAKYEEYLAPLSDTDRRFLTADMFDGGYAASLGAIRARLTAFTSDDLFLSMFTNPRNRFNLFKLLQEPKVILVNTKEGMLKSAKEPFGRFFIAKLLQATEERMFVPRDKRLPVFAYIDEAQDYIKHDEKIRELTEKARKQNVNLTIAVHEIQDLDETVRNALRKVAIQFWPSVNYPKWNVSVANKEPVEISVPPVDFGKMERMSEEQFQAILTQMREAFSVERETPTHIPPPSSPQPQPPTEWHR